MRHNPFDTVQVRIHNHGITEQNPHVPVALRSTIANSPIQLRTQNVSLAFQTLLLPSDVTRLAFPQVVKVEVNDGIGIPKFCTHLRKVEIMAPACP